MQSKKSFFNVKIFLSNIKRSWPMLLIISAIGLLVPVVYLSGGSSANGYDSFMIQSVTTMYLSTFFPMNTVFTFVYAPVVASIVWNYMYKGRSIGFFHSIPMTRNTLFITNYTSGLVLMIIPYIPSALLMTFITISQGRFSAGATGYLLAAILLESIAFFSLATLVAHVVGNFVALVGLYGMVNFISLGFEYIVGIILEDMIPGVNHSFSRQSEFLAPIVNIMSNVCYNSNKACLSNFHIVAVYALIGIVLSGLALILYLNRKSENAGETIAFGGLKIVCFIVLTVILSMMGGTILDAFITRSSSSVGNGFILAICMIGIGAIVFTALLMVIERSSKIFNKKNMLMLAGCSVFYFLLCMSFTVDIFNIGGYVPSTESVKSLQILSGDQSIDLESTDEELLNKAVALHKAMTETDNLSGNLYTEETEYTTVYFYYTLKSGRSISREYAFDLTYHEGTEAERCFNDLFTDERNFEKLLHTDDNYVAMNAYVYVSYTDDKGESVYSDNSISKSNCGELTEALIADGTEGTWRPFTYDSLYNENSITIDIQFIEAGTNYDRNEWITADVNSDMKNTIEFLKKASILSDEDLENRSFGHVKRPNRAALP